MRARVQAARSGMTLLETLISVAIVSIVLSTIGTFSFHAVRNGRAEQAQSVALALGRRAIEVLGRDITAATQVCASSTAASMTLSLPGYDATSIVAGLWDTVQYQYNANSQVLTRTVTPDPGSLRPAAANQAVAQCIGSLQFRYLALETFYTNVPTSSVSLEGRPIPGHPVRILVNGANFTGTVTVSPSTGLVSFAPAIAAGQTIEVWYPLDPENGANDPHWPKVRQVMVTTVPTLPVNGAEVNPTARLTFTLRNRMMLP